MEADAVESHARNGVTDAASDTRTSVASGSPSVLVAGGGDDADLVSTLLARDGYSVTRLRDGWAALDHLRHLSVDLVLLDAALCGLVGIDLCRLLKRDHATRFVPVMLLLSGHGSREERLQGIEAGVDELVSTPVDVPEMAARIRSLIRVKRCTDDFEMAASVMTTLATMIEARDRYTEGHCHRMANYASALGRLIGLGGEDIHVLRRGGFLHDIGMIAVPDAVLLKPAALDPAERALIRSHPVIGESLIVNLRSLQPVGNIVRHHHERRDGSGYPDGLRDDEIPLSAQIVGMVDIFEALTSPRPYQTTRSKRGALEILRHQVNRGWHREDLFDAFIHVVHTE
jgi:putative two-component system response regulator